MQNLSQPFPKPVQTLEQENRQKASCIIGGESKTLGFHQETMEESRKQQDWFCIKLYIISYQISCILAV